MAVFHSVTPLQPAIEVAAEVAVEVAVDDATELFTELAATLLAADDVVVPEQAPRLDQALLQAQPTPGS